jgi:hypothetical protein
MNARVTAGNLKGLPNLNDPMALLIRAENYRNLLLERADQCLIPAISKPDPQQPARVTGTVGQMEEVLVFADQNHRALYCVIPQLNVACFVHAKIKHVKGVFSMFNQKAS